MPKNKRVKVVALTQTVKKGRERKVALAEAVRDCTDKFSHAYVMQTVNMKTALMQSIRQDWKERGVFIHGKLKVLSLGVGVSPSTEAKPNMHKLAEHIGPDCLLFFTNEGPKEVAKYCEAWAFSDHARSGFECTSTFVLPKGPVPQFTFSQDEMLRKLGVPVRLHDGIILLDQDHTIASAGQKLTPEQAHVLRLLDVKMAESRISPKCVWYKGKFKAF